MTFLRLLGLSLLTGLLFVLSWFPNGFFPLIFIAWLPLLYIEKHFSLKNKTSIRFYWYSLIATLVWNVGVTWWIKNASIEGAAMAIITNSIVMAIVLYLFHFVKVKKGAKLGYMAFVCFWLSFEFIHYRWDISWPWLNLGNVFAPQIRLIQWYEYTGVLGGSLWILIANLFLFFIYEEYKTTQRLSSKWKFTLLWMLIPVGLSLLIFYTYKEKINPINVVIVQPNIDPYNEKFDEMSGEEQLKRFLNLAETKLTDKTDYLLGPETALVDYIWENKIEESPAIKTLQVFIKKYPKLNIIIGASTNKFYLDNEKPSVTARIYGNSDKYFDSYNTALQLDNSGKIQLYHKSKLVPGVEKMPWPALFKPLEKYAISLGGTTGSLGMQDEPTVFTSVDKKYIAAPIVCYESIYGAYIGDYAKKGANFLAIITNDGWWGDTPGYKQHLAYGAISAIATRRSIVRSANTGISAIINQKGEISKPTQWWQQAIILVEINCNNTITFYSRYGDYIGIMAIVMSILLLITLFFRKLLF